MRLCLATTQQHWGGGEALLLSIAQELAASGHCITWIAREHSQVIEQLVEHKQSILHGMRKRGLNWHDWFAIVGLLRQWAPDIVVLNDTHAVPVVGAACWSLRSPRPVRLAYKHTIFPLRSKLKYQLLADQMLCVSSAARQTLLDGGIAAERCSVIYGGCHLPQVDASQVAQTREALGLQAGQRMLLCVGSLLDCKGHADLLESMPQVLQPHPNARLFIAGEGDQRTALESQVSLLQLGSHVALLGYRSDANQLLAAADVVVHPSHAEGLSLVLILAQMLEKPIVATAVGGAAEVLQADAPEQCSSWIAQPHQPSDLANKLQAALNAISGERFALDARLSKTAARARSMFDIRVNAQQLADHCARLLDKR